MNAFRVISAVFAFLFAQTESRAEIRIRETTEVPWVVELLLDSTKRCTGTVLAERWILTTVRCLKGGRQTNVRVTYGDAQGTRRVIYDGNSVLHGHRYYQTSVLSPWFNDIPNADYDVALIELLEGSIDLSVTGRAKLYAPSRPWPWSTSGANRDFAIIGWGNTERSVCVCAGNTGTPGCEETAVGKKYLGTGMTFDSARLDAESIRSQNHMGCADSFGAPWLLQRDGEYLLIAVTHGRHTYFTWTEQVDAQYAALITTKTMWIWEASRNLRYEPAANIYRVYGLSCGGGGGNPGYIECFERAGGVVVPPPPAESACGTGHHCCAPMGNECRQCLPDNRACP